MSFFGNLSKGVKKKFNPFSVGKDVGGAILSHLTPVLSYAIAPSLGPLSGIISTMVTSGLNFTLGWGLQKWEKWDDRKDVEKAEKALKKSIAKYMQEKSPAVEKEKRNKLADWLQVYGNNNKYLIKAVRSGKVNIPNLNPSLPKGSRKVKKIQGNLQKWLSIE